MLMRAAALLVAGGLLAGCTADQNPFARGGDDRPGNRAQLAAFAATSEYPDQEPSDDLRMTALVQRDGNNITILNPSNQQFTNARVWINGQFVSRLDAIPANGTVTINRNQFYDRRGQSLIDTQTVARSIQLQTADDFYNLLGPVFE